MRVYFTAGGWDRYVSWHNDTEILGKINGLIEKIRRHPFTGTGKPEALKNPLAGWWSRRITQEHRLVYKVEGSGDDQRVIVSSCRYHYG